MEEVFRDFGAGSSSGSTTTLPITAHRDRGARPPEHLQPGPTTTTVACRWWTSCTPRADAASAAIPVPWPTWGAGSTCIP